MVLRHPGVECCTSQNHQSATDHQCFETSPPSHVTKTTERERGQLCSILPSLEEREADLAPPWPELPSWGAEGFVLAGVFLKHVTFSGTEGIYVISQRRARRTLQRIARPRKNHLMTDIK